MRLPAECAKKSVIFVCGGQESNANALPLSFAAHSARAMGAAKVGPAAPYLAYMRQDARFHAGEAVSALAYAQFLSKYFDWMATVDLHLHRIESLDEVFSIPTECISSAPAMSDWIAANVETSPLMIGLDSESMQWASGAAQRIGVPWAVLHKDRTGDRQVSGEPPGAETPARSQPGDHRRHRHLPDERWWKRQKD